MRRVYRINRPSDNSDIPGVDIRGIPIETGGQKITVSKGPDLQDEGFGIAGERRVGRIGIGVVFCKPSGEFSQRIEVPRVLYYFKRSGLRRTG